jgi:hypothetical protein
VSPVRYELGFYIPEDGILHSHRSENLNLSLLIPDIRTQLLQNTCPQIHVSNRALKATQKQPYNQNISTAHLTPSIARNVALSDQHQVGAAGQSEVQPVTDYKTCGSWSIFYFF